MARVPSACFCSVLPKISAGGEPLNLILYSVSQERRCLGKNLVVILQKLVNFASSVKQNVIVRNATVMQALTTHGSDAQVFRNPHL